MTILIVTGAVWTLMAALSGVSAFRHNTARRRLDSTRRRLENVLDQAATDRAFAVWANWTMLSVTDQDGMVYAATLRQLHNLPLSERVWDAPIAVALWHGNPDVIEQYENELKEDGLHGT